MKKFKSFLLYLFSFALMITLTACGSAQSPSQPQSDPQSDQKSKEQETQVVDLTGLAEADVDAWISEAGIPKDQVLYAWEYSETIQQGKVIRQSLPAGTALGSDTLTVTLSNGPDPDQEITLIDFTGMSLDDIQKWFRNEHFQHVSIEYVYDPNTAPGTFLGTSVTDGKALRHDPITVRIAGDPEQAGVAVFVPDMNGWTRADAEKWANENQITIDYGMKMSDSVPAGSIISFNPAAGSELIKGDHMNALVSAGNQAQAIDLSGKSREDIDAWGKDNGIVISYVQCWNEAPSGTAYWNQPNSGMMRMGDIMNVYISVGPIPVQNYTGLSYQNNFSGWLGSINTQYNGTANLSVNVTEQETPDQESGIILSQDPSSGYINPGSTINMVIAKHVVPPQPSTIPVMTGTSESDFLNNLSSWGLSPGSRVEQYDRSVDEGCIISNDTGPFSPGEGVDYIVSLGEFTVIPQYWAGKDYHELNAYIDSANRMGAGVNIDIIYEPTNDASAHDRIHMVQGPADDGELDVWVWRLTLYNDDGDDSGDDSSHLLR